MAFLGVEVGSLEPGRVELRLAWRRDLAQNHGYFHGGVIATLADNAAGGAAGTLASEGALGVTAEFKINIVAPGKGEFVVARGEVIKPGRRLTVARSDVFAVADGVERMCATALVTLVMGT
jgi:uncharacterized protein (TIGR00369 family)